MKPGRGRDLAALGRHRIDLDQQALLGIEEQDLVANNTG
jgi:hypothetical protein